MAMASMRKSAASVVQRTGFERSPTVWAVRASSIRQPQSLPARECGSPWEPLSTLRTGAHQIHSSRRAVHEDLNHRIGDSASLATVTGRTVSFSGVLACDLARGLPRGVENG